MDFVVELSTTPDPAPEPGVNVWGLIGVLVFYLLILFVGIYASWKNKALKSQNSEDVLLAGRSIGILVGSFTMTATWVGGGFINGTAEKVYTSGLAWAQAPIGYSISLALGGMFFAKKMREARYVTMLDPFQNKYGPVLTVFMYIPACLGELLWSAAILNALGATLAVILHMSHDISILISAGVVVIYTVIGGLFSVAFTDVIQLICIFIGLWLGCGFALANDAVTPLHITAHINPVWNTDTNATWLGHLPNDSKIGYYIDNMLLLMCGGIPWQVYFQRVLACESAKTAQKLSFIASFGCIFLVIPAVIIGAIGRSVDWSQTDYTGSIPLEKKSHALILPLVLQYLTPTAVSVIGLGAVSAAVMSSADSSALSSSTMFAHNVYRPIRTRLGKTKPSDSEILWVMRVCVVLVGVFATAVAVSVDSIYGLFYLCSDLIYVILFPQLVTVIYYRSSNTYGSIAGYLIGFIFRLTGGEPELSLDPLIYYPWWYDKDGVIYQNFPFKTLSMLISLSTIFIVSHITNTCFRKGIIPMKYDKFNCIASNPGLIADEQLVDDRKDSNTQLGSNDNDVSYGSVSRLSTLSATNLQFETNI